MARYFFRADYKNSSVNDNVGEEFSTLQGAEAHAIIVANELARNSTEAVTVAVLSENGILLAKAPTSANRLRHGGESRRRHMAWQRRRRRTGSGKGGETGPLSHRLPPGHSTRCPSTVDKCGGALSHT
jgi:hypothetical protein